MGTDKALLLIEGEPMIVRVSRAVREAAGSAVVVGGAERYRDLIPGVPGIDDLHPGLGPLSGMEAALASVYAAEWNLIVACDLPGVEATLLRALLPSGGQCRAQCRVAVDPESGRRHPSCAIYRRDCLAAVQEAVATGELRATKFLEQLDVEEVVLPATLVNVNTPAEWSAWPRK